MLEELQLSNDLNYTILIEMRIQINSIEDDKNRDILFKNIIIKFLYFQI